MRACSPKNLWGRAGAPPSLDNGRGYDLLGYRNTLLATCVTTPNLAGELNIREWEKCDFQRKTPFIWETA